MVDNNTAFEFLTELETQLSQRINSIQALNKANTPFLITKTLKAFGLSIALAVGVYILYKKLYVPHTSEFNAIVKDLEGQGIKVTDAYNIHLEIPTSNLWALADEKGKRLADIKNSQYEFGPFLLTGAAWSVFSFLEGICSLLNINDQTLISIYKTRLIWIKELKKSISGL